MTSRFFTNLLLLVLAGFLVAASFAFAAVVTGWLALGVGCVAVLVSFTGFALRYRGAAQRTLDVVIALIATWTIVASRVFGSGTVKWMSFAGAAALVVLAVTGLILHELTRPRLVASGRPPGAEDGHRDGYHEAHDLSPRPAVAARSGVGNPSRR